MTDVPNQSKFQEDQNFKIDINKIFDDFIKDIDAARSFASVNSQNQKLFEDLYKKGKDGVMSIPKLVKMEKTFQESRCHAFYRLIGFPVVSKVGNDLKIYNPGHDITVFSEKKIDLLNKISIASTPIDGFNALSNQRENFAQSNFAIFSVSQSIEAGALALSSGGTKKLRRFVSSLEKSDKSLDMSSDNQTYNIETTGLVGGKEVLLKDYQDANGNLPKKLSATRTHIIKPFIVDARIDFAVNPQSRLVAVPFVLDKSNTKVSAITTENVKRPLLEKLIRDRFAVSDATVTAGTAADTTLKNIATSLNIKDDGLVKLVSSKDIYKQSEKTQFIQFINIIQTMMHELVNAQRLIHKAQGDYYWVPAPSSSGPEGGSTVQGVFLPNVIKSSLITPRDSAIIVSKSKAVVSDVNTQSATATSEPDVGNFALSSYTTTFGSDTSAALGDNNAKNLETLSKKRFRILSVANNALRTIEIIMGEFSGFGLCDIIAIMGALNIMPKEYLLGFLDVDSVTRMKSSVKATKDLTPPSFQDSIDALTSTVKDFYNLMDTIYQNILESHGIS